MRAAFLQLDNAPVAKRCVRSYLVSRKEGIRFAWESGGAA